MTRGREMEERGKERVARPAETASISISFLSWLRDSFLAPFSHFTTVRQNSLKKLTFRTSGEGSDCFAPRGMGGGRCGPSPSYCTANSRSYFVIKASKIWPRYVVLTFLHIYEPQLFLNCSRLAGCWRLVSRRRSNELS